MSAHHILSTLWKSGAFCGGNSKQYKIPAKTRQHLGFYYCFLKSVNKLNSGLQTIKKIAEKS